jgi:hypothetical protein
LDHGLQGVEVGESDVLAIDHQKSFLVEAGEEAADGFDGQTQVVADLVAGHAEVEIGGAQAALLQAVGEAEQEGGQAVLGALLAQQEQHLGLLGDLLAEEAVHLVLKGGDGDAEFLEAGKGHLADGGGLQDLGGAAMGIMLDGVQADDFTRQMKAQHLFPTFRAGGKGLDGAGLDDEEGAEAVAAMKKIVSTVQGAAAADDGVQAFHVLGGQPQGQAEGGEIAIPAGDPYGLEGYHLVFVHR